jgi:hypothetical protein
MPTLYIAITNHGFGHATRAAAVAATIRSRHPDLRLILATTSPRSVLEAYLGDDFMHRERSFDVGVVQADSMTMDLPQTLAKLQAIQANAAAVIESEAAWIKEQGVDLILGDIPPLMGPIAKAAGVPCWMMGNFGWDFIYRAFGAEFDEVADWISECFGQCDLLFRLPFHEPMTSFGNVVDVGLTGVTPRFETSEIIKAFGLENVPKENRVLMTFGGLGLARIPYENVQHFPEYRFLCFDLGAPDYPNLIKVDDRVYRPVDLMESCGCLISKPGYSTFSEACRLDLPIISLVREGFAEAPILLAGLRDCAWHQVIELDAFFGGSWDFLRESLQPPSTLGRLDKMGNAAIADAVTGFFGRLEKS